MPTNERNNEAKTEFIPPHHDDTCNAFEMNTADPDCARCRWIRKHGLPVNHDRYQRGR